MKLNLVIDIDWIDEEMSIDDVVKQEIINAITNKINKKAEEQVEKKVNEVIDKTIVENINNKTDLLFDEFMNREISVTDGYGDPIKVYQNINELIKSRFDNFMSQKVDNKGRTYDGSSYGSKKDRLTYLIDDQLKSFADKFTTDAVNQVSEEIKLHVQNGLTTKLGAELMKVLKVNKMIGIPENGK